MFILSYYYYKIFAYHHKIFLYLFKKIATLLYTRTMIRTCKIPNLLTWIKKKHYPLNSPRSPAVTESFVHVKRQKSIQAETASQRFWATTVEKHRVVFTGRALCTIQRSGLVFFFFFPFPLSSLFFIPLLPIPSVSPPVARSTERRERFISTTPVAIVPFVSQPASHASRRRAFSLTSSVFHPIPLLPPPLPVRWLTRTPYGRFDRWTNRPVVISTYPQVHA